MAVPIFFAEELCALQKIPLFPEGLPLALQGLLGVHVDLLAPKEVRGTMVGSLRCTRKKVPSKSILKNTAHIPIPVDPQTSF